MARLCVPVAGISSVFNNTPMVAMLLPEVASWARSRRLPVSRFLMPLSFAAILGGTVTLIGTSTNLVVSGVMEQQGYEPFGLFELTPVGLPVALAGLAVLIGRRHPAPPRPLRSRPRRHERAARVRAAPRGGARRAAGRHLDHRRRPAQPVGRVPGRHRARRPPPRPGVSPDEVLGGRRPVDLRRRRHRRARPPVSQRACARRSEQAEVLGRRPGAARTSRPSSDGSRHLVGRTLKEVGGRTRLPGRGRWPSTGPVTGARASSATSSCTPATPSCCWPAATCAPPAGPWRTSWSSLLSATPCR